MSDTEPSDVFRAYLAPVAIDPNTAHVAERWAGTRAWSAKAEVEQIPALVAVFRGASADENSVALASFFQAQTAEDETFNIVSAPELARVLSAAALDYLFTNNGTLDTAASLAVLTSSWGGRPPSGLAVDIVARAAAELDNIAALRRDRPTFAEALKGLGTAPVLNPTPSITKIKEGQLDHVIVAAAFDEMLKATSKAIVAQATHIRAAVGVVDRRLRQSDEELDILWYVFGGVSDDGGAFSDLDPKVAAFYVPREIESLSSQPLFSDVAADLFRRCGCTDKVVRFTDTVEALSTDWIAANASGEFSPSLFPIHRALHRFRDIAETQTWIAGWSKSTGIDPELKIAPVELAVDFYRERLLISALK